MKKITKQTIYPRRRIFDDKVYRLVRTQITKKAIEESKKNFLKQPRKLVRVIKGNGKFKYALYMTEK